MESGTLVLDKLTQREFLVVGKLTDGQYLLLESCEESADNIEELNDDRQTIIKDLETILRYSHQIEEV